MITNFLSIEENAFRIDLVKQGLKGKEADKLEDYVIHLLRDYNYLKAQSIIEGEKLCDIEPRYISSYEGMPHTKSISNPTANLAIKRISIPQVSRLVRIIEISFNALTKDCKQLIKLFYFEKMRKYEVCTEMNISEDQFRRYRRIAIDTIKKILIGL
jgi:DNA-directed RNA polymerase specialized sigma subunit